MNGAVLNSQLKESQPICALSPHSLLLLLSPFFLCRSCTTTLCSNLFKQLRFVSSHHIFLILNFPPFKSHFAPHFFCRLCENSQNFQSSKEKEQEGNVLPSVILLSISSVIRGVITMLQWLKTLLSLSLATNLETVFLGCTTRGEKKERSRAEG